MNIFYTRTAERQLAALSPKLRQVFYKQVEFLGTNLRQPSLQAKKYDVANDVWQGRVNRSWRFYFTVDTDAYTILAVVPHPK